MNFHSVNEGSHPAKHLNDSLDLVSYILYVSPADPITQLNCNRVERK